MTTTDLSELPTLDTVLLFLDAQRQIRTTMHEPGYEGAFQGPEDLLFRHGRVFAELLPVDADEPYRRQGGCYTNALEVSLRYRDRGGPVRIYCEGYAALPDGFPVKHAWTVDEAGRVYDPTWGAEPGSAYLGLPVADRFLAERLSAQGLPELLCERFPYAEPLPGDALEAVGAPVPPFAG